MKRFVFIIVLLLAFVLGYNYLIKGRNVDWLNHDVEYTPDKSEKNDSITSLCDVMDIPDEYTLEYTDNPIGYQSIKKDNVIYTFYYEEGSNIENVSIYDLNKDYIELFEDGSHSFQSLNKRNAVFYMYTWRYIQTPDMIFGDSGDSYWEQISSDDFDVTAYDSIIKLGDRDIPVQKNDESLVECCVCFPFMDGIMRISYSYYTPEVSEKRELDTIIKLMSFVKD